MPRPLPVSGPKTKHRKAFDPKLTRLNQIVARQLNKKPQKGYLFLGLGLGNLIKNLRTDACTNEHP
jgi:hypothetical protein